MSKRSKRAAKSSPSPTPVVDLVHAKSLRFAEALKNAGVVAKLSFAFFDPETDAIGLYDNAESVKGAYKVVRQGAVLPRVCALSDYFDEQNCKPMKWSPTDGFVGAGTHVYTPPLLDAVVVFVPTTQAPSPAWCQELKGRIEVALQKRNALRVQSVSPTSASNHGRRANEA